ncbi:hypothetical protein FRB99_007118 [Tulasnella sp. 403]|nr:hypothetical protein FRB99_007118 [Tulasnella sp. 403]
MSEADSDRDFVLTAVDPDHEPNAPRLHTSWAFSTGGEAKTEIWLTPTSDEITALPFRHLFIEWSFCMNLSSGNIYLTRSMKEFVTGAADEFCKVSFKLVDPD